MTKLSAEVVPDKVWKSCQKAAPVKDEQKIGAHIVIMVHGFQGNHGDMRVLRNHINLQNPHCVMMLSLANEDQTEGDLFEMGERLSSEVKKFIINFAPAECISKISFVGHSLGGLIIRAALPHLTEY